MFTIVGQVQHYPWGSADAIPGLLEVAATGEPHAEYWLGAHPKAPAATALGPDLRQVIAETPALLGAASRAAFGDRLPYLFKLLSADQALSIQAHPSRAQARAGWAREEAAGLAADDPTRNYRDDWPKPELIVALTHFEGLCGFAEPARLRDHLARLNLPALAELAAPLAEPDGIATVFGALLARGDAALVAAAVAAARPYADPAGDEFARWCDTAVRLAADYPGDPGVLAALLMHRFTLEPGQALFLPAGNLHAYLRGTGVEVMSNSDNVLRGGLTGKHVDVAELTAVVDFAPGFPGPVPTRESAPGVLLYATPAPEFRLYRLHDPHTELPGDGAARIVYVLDGALTLRGDTELRLTRGAACFVPAAEKVRVEGRGEAFVATPGLDPIRPS
ncbi:mannose-6-phosphate isomerase, class I [Granulicoccus phenolivorans]|uniref:mannose-6-phosphate isomerase, class I n=1 Tax=Granulicoccus phenolivorans TaxID=266854 RepID=UPI0004056F90|nr:mannose-6-phosphate isomerase, class I [Granulicoccus phenolivorans]